MSHGNGDPLEPAPVPMDEMGGPPVAYLGCPSYDGWRSEGSARAMARPAAQDRLRVRVKPWGGSLLGAVFNVLWAWALNDRHQGRRLDYFAMLHADVEPEDFWLEKLVDELERKKLDVLSAVVPIKDQRGLTSTAVDGPGAPWKARGRLTMREVYRLPETFTADDLGAPLLINTGCWVCKWNQSWTRKLHFTINDRVVFDPGRGLYWVQMEPEDWFVSRCMNEMGLRVGATRKVRLAHVGAASFRNDHPWGEEYDREHCEASLLPDHLAGFRFPVDVPGWLDEAEGRELARLAQGQPVLEIGSYCGRSTLCLAQTAVSVGACDPFDGRATNGYEGSTLRAFTDHVCRWGLERKVNVLKGTSAEVLPGLPQVFGLVFIDGDHSYPAVKADIALALKVLRPGGVLAFHDYGKADGCDPGVTKAVDEFLAAGARLERVVGSLAVVRPHPDLPPAAPPPRLSLVQPEQKEVPCGV